MKYKFTEFFDISTSTDGFQMFTISAGGMMTKLRCLPYFGLFKHFKLGKVRVKLVPSSTLPVDPTGLSYEAGESTVDPRDMFNPGLVRITNGENVTSFIGTDAQNMNQYYATMLDNRWFKFRLQSGFTRTAKPLVYNVAMPAPGFSPGKYYLSTSTSGEVDRMSYSPFYQGTTPVTSEASVREAKRDVLMATGKVKLGWMPTTDLTDPGYEPLYGNVPEVPLITFVLPKAYKTKFYYRVFVSEEVYFKDPIAVNPIVETIEGHRYAYKPIDSFVHFEPELVRTNTNKTTILPLSQQEVK